MRQTPIEVEATMPINLNADVGGGQQEQGDWLARQFFSVADLRMSPEEYAAHHAHLWGCFSLHLHQYADPVLGDWIRRLGAILESEDEIKRCQQRYLGVAELAKVCEQEL
jgi:hypothetical protein